MTENSEELAELQRAHAAFESKVETILPTLATKADLEAMGRHLTEHFDLRLDQRIGAMNPRFDAIDQRFDATDQRMDQRFHAMDQRFDAMDKRIDQRFDAMDNRMDQRFDAMNQRLDSLQKTMTDGFNRIWLWIAGTLVAVIVAILGSSWFAPARQAAPTPPAAPVVYNLYPPGYTAVPAMPVAPVAPAPQP